MSGFWAPHDKPANRLARYRALSPLASVHVSPLQLGAMSIGDKWEKYGMGSMNKESSFKLLDAFYDAGGNFIDTANNYQDQSSEEFIGEWAEQRGIRDQLVIATKYTTNFQRGNSKVKQQAMYTGNSFKAMHISVEASLKKLRTSYIDILYVHWWDYDTSVEEVMDGLHTFVQQGKVLYLGISDTPAWIVSKANQYARDHGKSPFVIYQGAWNVMERSFERDIIPMARSEGLALAPWNVIAAGKFRTDEEEERRRQTGEKVAIAYVMQKTPYVFPIIGGRKIEQLEANIEALEISLSPDQIAYLESILPFDPGFPNTFIVSDLLLLVMRPTNSISHAPLLTQGDGTHHGFALLSAAYLEKQPLLQAIRPEKA
ncbi:hypothetical protein SERLA73DRAFT_138475 [Serpula lacrymans var. lacrymans S7.3]|uniref:NADP-dependent oxidoreductase domain-containing protein n=1 Tax=Serpula lacrymans var. lacrymans (strain S7.3) TaxID=936435 RepID=F8Q1I9_SERL3|nr:hypothetical protein SERLA73DRAFT_138475 [Serpula lacrymans var. lacrymans S7.3]